MSFIFGGDTQMTYEQAKRQQQMAQQLMGQNKGRSRNMGEGIASFTEQITNAMMGRRANKEMDRQRAEYNQRFEQAYPQAAGSQAYDMYSDPRASDSQRDIIKALNSGVPGFRRGTMSAPGGMAVVGEDGPELVNLPQGAQVVPNPATLMGQGYDPVYEGPQAPEPDEYLREELGDELFRAYEQMNPLQRQQFMADPANGFAPPAASPESPVSIPQGDQSRFLDDQAYQTADMDALKLMSLAPQYGDTVEADVNTTEGQRLSYLRRMMFADMALEDPRILEALTKPTNAIAGKLGGLGRAFTGDQYEVGRLMAEAFSEAALRNDTGAQAPDTEVQRTARQYAPQTFEGQPQFDAKASLRREVMRSLEQSLGGDASPAVRQLRAEMEQLRAQADDEYVPPAQEAAPVDAAPEGVPQELWDVLTPEEKTAWQN